MPHYFAVLLFSIVPTVLGSLGTTTLGLARITFTTRQDFVNYFPQGTQGNGMAVQCECTATTGRGDALGKLSKWVPVNNNDRTAYFDDMSFTINNPADWITLTCATRLRILVGEGYQITTAYVQFYTASDDGNYVPSKYPLENQNKVYTDLIDWSLQAYVNKACSNGEYLNFNCDDACNPTTCNSMSAKICCPGGNENLDLCSCMDTPITQPTTPSPSNPPDNNNNQDFCTNEDLYFWIMIGLACLSGLLLILLIICLSYICCALSNEDEARKAQQTEAVRPPPPVYLSTPPRDPRYGYRGPSLDPYGRPEAGYREEYDADIDSLAAEWTEPPSERREARV